MSLQNSNENIQTLKLFSFWLIKKIEIKTKLFANKCNFSLRYYSYFKPLGLFPLVAFNTLFPDRLNSIQIQFDKNSSKK